MARPKSDNIQINISIPSEWKKELENLTRIYSVEEGETITYLDLMRSGIRKNISQLPIGICLGVSVAGILSLFQMHLKRTCPQDQRCNNSYITDNETFSI